MDYEDKIKRHITRDHKTCRFQWVFVRFVPPQAFATVDSHAAPQSGTFHTAKRQPVQKPLIVVHIL